MAAVCGAIDAETDNCGHRALQNAECQADESAERRGGKSLLSQQRVPFMAHGAGGRRALSAGPRTYAHTVKTSTRTLPERGQPLAGKGDGDEYPCPGVAAAAAAAACLRRGTRTVTLQRRHGRVRTSRVRCSSSWLPAVRSTVAGVDDDAGASVPAPVPAPGAAPASAPAASNSLTSRADALTDTALALLPADDGATSLCLRPSASTSPPADGADGSLGRTVVTLPAA